MKRLTIGLAVACCAAMLGAAPALADPGNTASNSIGTAQIGAVNASPTASSTSQAGTTTATAPLSVGAGDNQAGNSTGTAQVGGGNTSNGSTGTAQVSQTQASPAASTTASGHTVGATAPLGTTGSGNSSNGSTGSVQTGGGNDASGSTGTLQSGLIDADPAVAVDGRSTGLPVTTGNGGNEATGSTGTVQVGGGGPGARSLASAEAPASSAASASSPPTTGTSPAGGAVAAPAGTPNGLRTPPVQDIARRVLAASLPFTGSPLGRWLALGLALLLLGAGLRRRCAA